MKAFVSLLALLFVCSSCTTLPMFPSGSPWTKDVSGDDVADDSDDTIQWLSDQGGFGGGHLQIDFSINVNYADCNSPTVTYTTDTHDWGCDEPETIPLPSGGNLVKVKTLVT